MDTDPARRTKRLLIFSDPHSGHEFGLTPPKLWGNGDNPKAFEFRRALWGFATKAVESLKPIDVVFGNGDLIDGKGEKSGGNEQIVMDRLKQVHMIKEFIDMTEASQVRLFYGTRYHVGKDEDFESVLVHSLACKDVRIQGHGFIDINGCTFDVKHKVGSSAIPHGRMTALARARLWNAIWAAEHDRQPKADIIIRSHVHYFTYCGGANWMALTTPALCYNTSYGIRECEGLVDVGMVVFDIDENGGYSWKSILAKFNDLKARTESL